MSVDKTYRTNLMTSLLSMLRRPDSAGNTNANNAYQALIQGIILDVFATLDTIQGFALDTGDLSSKVTNTNLALAGLKTSIDTANSKTDLVLVQLTTMNTNLANVVTQLTSIANKINTGTINMKLL